MSAVVQDIMSFCCLLLLLEYYEFWLIIVAGVLADYCYRDIKSFGCLLFLA